MYIFLYVYNLMGGVIYGYILNGNSELIGNGMKIGRESMGVIIIINIVLIA